MNSTTILLIIHGLLAVALLGAVTHQAASVWLPSPRPADGFVSRFRAVAGGSYANAVVVLYAATFLLGGIVYAEYRIVVRMVLEQMELWAQNGSFELKEHFAAIGLGLLPAYWYGWRGPQSAGRSLTRDVLTALLAFVVWWNFLVGHILNNIRGFGS
jgi:hypothetical protein